MKIPFNLEYQIDKSLREVPIEAAEFRKGIEFLKTEIAHLKGIEKARACSKLGSLQRIQGELVESLHSLHLAGTLLKTFSNPRLSIINSLRLAQTFQFQGELTEANTEYCALKRRLNQTLQIQTYMILYSNTEESTILTKVILN
jgi:hypothetical protein